MKNWFTRKNTPALPPLAGYERWAETYAKESNPVKNLSNQTVENFLPDLNGKSILDAGCGTGHFCELVSRKGAVKIVGIDFSEKMIDQARINCPSAQFHCLDISEKSITQYFFDVAICALVLGHIENIQFVLKNLAQSLKPGGELIISDFHPFLTLHHSKRTFVDPQTGKSIEIRHYLHLFEEIVNTLADNGILTQHMEEPLWNNVPVIYALRAKKILS